MPTGAFPIWPHGNKCWQVSCSLCEARNVSPSPPHSLFFIPSIFCHYFPPSNSLFLSHTHTSAPSLWEMAPVFQLAWNGPLTRMASGELGPQQMLPWIARSSAACRLYWIVIRVELSIHDSRSGFAWEGMWPHQVNFILLLSVEPPKCSRLGTNTRRAVRFLFSSAVSIYIWLEKGGGRKKEGRQGARPAVGQRATSQSAAVCMICRLSVGLFMEHLATLHRGIWWLPWTHTDTHTEPYAPIVIPMSSDNIHFFLLSANPINANPMWRGPGQEDDSLQSGPWHTHTHSVASTLLSPRRLDWGNVN